MVVGSWQIECSIDPIDGLRVAVSLKPVGPERGTHRERGFRRRLADRPSKRDTEVVDVGVKRGEVRLAACAPERLFAAVRCADSEEVVVVALTDGVDVGRCRKALLGVGADRLEHHQPRLAVWLPAAHEQALGDEAVERVQTGAGDRLRRLHRRAAGEDGEAREAALALAR